MAGNEDRKAELIAQLAKARQQIDSSGTRVRQALDVPARVRSSFQKHAVVWMGGGLLAGVLIAALARRPRTAATTKQKETRDGALPKAGAAGLLVAGAKIVFDVCRPILIKWLMSRTAPLAEKIVARYTSHSHPDQYR